MILSIFDEDFSEFHRLQTISGYAKQDSHELINIIQSAGTAPSERSAGEDWPLKPEKADKDAAIDHHDAYTKLKCRSIT